MTDTDPVAALAAQVEQLRLQLAHYAGETGQLRARLDRDSDDEPTALLQVKKLSEKLDEAIGNQRVVRIFGGQEYESARFERASQQIRRFNMKHATAAAGTVPVTQLIVACAIAAIIYFAAGQAFAGSTGVLAQDLGPLVVSSTMGSAKQAAVARTMKNHLTKLLASKNPMDGRTAAQGGAAA